MIFEGYLREGEIRTSWDLLGLLVDDPHASPERVGRLVGWLARRMLRERHQACRRGALKQFKKFRLAWRLYNDDDPSAHMIGPGREEWGRYAFEALALCLALRMERPL